MINHTDLVLSDEEIEGITHCKRAKEQLRELERMNIPATRRVDNTVLVLRMYVTVPGAAPAAVPAANDEPQLKSSRK
ncbi:MAG: DUF4224 domain-containing protein [Pseudomonadota bacterium]